MGLYLLQEATNLAGRPPNSGKRIFNSRSLNVPSESSRVSSFLRPIWHHYSGRTRAHVFVCVLGYALWKTLDHLAKLAGLMTEIRKPDLRRPRSSPKARRMTPQMILRELRELGDRRHLDELDVRRSATGPASGRSDRTREPSAGSWMP